MRHLARDHCLAPERVDAPIEGGRYRRLFEDLPRLEADERALHELGRPGGPCDLGGDGRRAPDDATVAAVLAVLRPVRRPRHHRRPLAARPPCRPGRSATSALLGRTSRASTARARSAPVPLRARRPRELLLGPGGHDVPRNQQGIALVGDPRNDAHLFMNQMQVAFIGLHNRLVDRLREERRPRPTAVRGGAALGGLALPVGDPEGVPADADRRGAHRRLLDGGADRLPGDGEPYIPFEFADAAYRYGHSQIRHRYQVNAGFGPCPAVPRSDGVRRGAGRTGRLVAALRRPRAAARAALQADRGRLPALADRPATEGQRAGRD